MTDFVVQSHLYLAIRIHEIINILLFSIIFRNYRSLFLPGKKITDALKLQLNLNNYNKKLNKNYDKLNLWLRDLWLMSKNMIKSRNYDSFQNYKSWNYDLSQKYEKIIKQNYDFKKSKLWLSRSKLLDKNENWL